MAAKPKGGAGKAKAATARPNLSQRFASMPKKKSAGGGAAGKVKRNKAGIVIP